MSDEERKGIFKTGRRKPNWANIPFSASEIFLMVKVMNEQVAGFARIGEVARSLQGSALMRQAIALQQTMNTLLAENAGVIRMMGESAKTAQKMQDLFKAAKLPQIIAPTMISPATVRLGTAIDNLERAREERVSSLEARVKALEDAVKQLQELLEDPELPEATKEEIRKLLKDLPPLDYIQ